MTFRLWRCFDLQWYFSFNLNKWIFIFVLTVFQKRSHSLSTKIEVRGPQRAKPDQTSETHAQTYTHAFKKFFFSWVVPVCLIVCYLSMIKVRGFSIWKQGDNRRKHGGVHLSLFVWKREYWWWVRRRWYLYTSGQTLGPLLPRKGAPLDLQGRGYTADFVRRMEPSIWWYR